MSIDEYLTHLNLAPAYAAVLRTTFELYPDFTEAGFVAGLAWTGQVMAAGRVLPCRDGTFCEPWLTCRTRLQRAASVEEGLAEGLALWAAPSTLHRALHMAVVAAAAEARTVGTASRRGDTVPAAWVDPRWLIALKPYLAPQVEAPAEPHVPTSAPTATQRLHSRRPGRLSGAHRRHSAPAPRGPGPVTSADEALRRPLGPEHAVQTSFVDLLEADPIAADRPGTGRSAEPPPPQQAAVPMAPQPMPAAGLGAAPRAPLSAPGQLTLGQGLAACDREAAETRAVCRFMDWLQAYGRLIRTPEGRLFYAYDPARAVYALDTEPWIAWLRRVAALNHVDVEVEALAAHIRRAALTSAEVMPLPHATRPHARPAPARTPRPVPAR